MPIALSNAAKAYLKTRLGGLLRATKEELPGITKIRMCYNGSSDNGEFDSPEPYLGDELWAFNGAFEEAFIDFGYELLEELYLGWENNEGSWGCITIHDNGTVSVKHTDLQPVSDKLVLFEDE